MKTVIYTTLALLAGLALMRSATSIVNADPASAPATQPATHPAAPTPPDLAVVHHGDIHLDIHADGYFESVGGTEVRLEPKAYSGELKIAAIAQNGAKVKKGDTLLAIDQDEFHRQLSAAENETQLAHANLAKSQSDVALGAKADALALAMQQEHQSEATGSVMWWEKVDGPIQLAIADFSAREADYQLQDAEDELAELRKMYKSEELTNATTSIVVKRKLQEIELGKIADTVDHEQADEFSKFHYDFLHHQISDQAASAEQTTSQLQAQQTQSKVVRQTSLVGAQSVADAADRKLADLRADEKLLTVVAPADGMVLYGQLTGGNWQNNDEQALRVGQVVQPRQVVLTFFTPGKIRAAVELPEAQFFSLPTGAKATVSPAAFAGESLAGVCDPSPPQGHAAQGSFNYMEHISLPDNDDRLIPGMRAIVSIHPTLASNVLVIPLTAVSAGQVWVSNAEGKTEARDVVLGKSDGTLVEVRSGLADGDKVLTHAKK